MTTQIIIGDALASLKGMATGSVHMICTSPPYFKLRSYLPPDHPDKALEMGDEPSLADYVAGMVGLLREARRVLRDDGCLLLNLGDSYAGSWGAQGRRETPRKEDTWHGSQIANHPKKARLTGSIRDDGLKAGDLQMVPAAVAMALRQDGWFLRSQMPWIKRSCMPESVTNRPTSAIEYVFLLTKRSSYFWDAEAVKVAGAIPAGTRGGKASAARAGAEGVNSRPAEYATYSGTRNFRNSDLFFSSLGAPHGLLTDADGNPLALDVNTAAFPGSHFATFPPRLVEPLIKAATSERGCCPACLAPWVRVLGDAKPTGGRGAANGFKRDARLSYADADGARGDDTVWVPKTRETTGWQPSCRCPPADPIPCVVLDPFAGAFTTSLVCERLGRDSIAIELNEEYARMGQNRLEDDALLFVRISQPRSDAPQTPVGARSDDLLSFAAQD